MSTSIDSVWYQKKVFKVIVLGDSGVGKTCLLFRFCEREIPLWKHPFTVGVDFISRTVCVDQQTLELQFWDTSGQERFHNSMTSHYYRKVDGVIFVYDVTIYESFKNLTLWIDEFNLFNHSDIPRILIGNKCDLVNEKAVGRRRALAFADYHGMSLFETSATDDGKWDPIDFIFENFALEISKHKTKTNTEQLSIKLYKFDVPKNKDRCCLD